MGDVRTHGTFAALAPLHLEKIPARCGPYVDWCARSSPAWSAWAKMELEAVPEPSGVPDESHVDRARNLLSRALHADPNHRQSLMLLAKLEEGVGNAAGSRRALKRILRDHPRDTRALLSLALVESRTGDARAARKLFRAGRDAMPSDAALLSAWASFESKQGNNALAR